MLALQENSFDDGFELIKITVYSKKWITRFQKGKKNASDNFEKDSGTCNTVNKFISST